MGSFVGFPKLTSSTYRIRFQSEAGITGQETFAYAENELVPTNMSTSLMPI